MGFGPILNAGTVADLSTDCGDTVLCDVRWYLDGRSGLEAYEAGHLPGAVFVDLDEDLTGPPGPEVGRHPLPSAAAFARSMGELGIGPDDTVVAYDDSGGMSAGRLVWMLRVLGQPAALPHACHPPGVDDPPAALCRGGPAWSRTWCGCRRREPKRTRGWCPARPTPERSGTRRPGPRLSPRRRCHPPDWPFAPRRPPSWGSRCGSRWCRTSGGRTGRRHRTRRRTRSWSTGRWAPPGHRWSDPAAHRRAGPGS